MSRRKRQALATGSPVVALLAADPIPERAQELLALLQGGPYTVEVPGSDPGEADIIIWTHGAALSAPLPVGPALTVVDRRGLVADAAHAACCRGAGLVLVRSEAEYGAWSTMLGSVPIAVIPPVATPGLGPSGALRSLHIVVGDDPSAATIDAAARASVWAAANGVAAGVADPAGAAGLACLSRIGAAPPPGEGSVVLDARLGGPGLLAIPDAVITAMARGAPVLCCGETPLRRELERSGAGLGIDAIMPGLDGFAALSEAKRRAMSAAALDWVGSRFGAEPAAASLSGALASGLARARRAAACWMEERPGLRVAEHVLVLSDEPLNLLDVRVHLPFGTLHRRGVIGGYTVLRHGEFAAGTEAVTPDTRFDAVWVHRSVDPDTQALVAALDRPFVYDIDDCLLVSPAYRAPFPPETAEGVRAMLASCTVLSCATPALFRALDKRGGTKLLEKSVVTPNLAPGAPRTVRGEARAVVWASSDTPALTRARREVERAVRDFCLAHGLALVCLGAEPPEILARSGIPIEHVVFLSHAGYMARLRELAPGILVGPLETGAEPDTQDFVDSKSDVKVIEAGLAGLVGVFSRAAPYRGSELAPAILCENTYESWLEGLERAFRLCAEPGPARAWPAPRAADQLGPMPWAEAVRRGRLDRALPAAEVTEAVRVLRERRDALVLYPDAFDEEDYLRRHEDVRLAVEQGVVSSGFQHYVASGIHEGRAARRRPGPEATFAAWWARVSGALARAEADAKARDAEITALRGRVALSGLRPRPTPELPPLPAPAGAEAGVEWHPPGAELDQPCPVCDAAAPHPVLLRTQGHTLARCRSCASCFYARRVAYEYERETDAESLLPVTLEQNASIYHQTRLLFAVDREIDSVLDVGCGFGFAADLAADVLGWRAVGIDPSFYAREGAALLRADIRQEYLTERTELGARFALVIASEVIEHVPDPYGLLAILRRWLQPGATLVLTTPDAAALEPGIGPGSLTGILAVGVHLILFTKESLAAALRRAGFRQVRVDSAQDNLIAYASDRPLRLREDAAARHADAYRRYLEHLVETAEPASPLWNGAAGRLMALLAAGAELNVLQALHARIAGAWRERYGFDLLRRRLPEPIAEARFSTDDPQASIPALVAREPTNLATVLYTRAIIEARTPGRTPESVLAFARLAYLTAVQTRRILERGGIVDLDLKMTAWRARLLIIDCLAELAPEVEGELLRGLAEPSPGALQDRLDLPAEALAARLAPYFAREVQADRFDAARRVERWMGGLDLLCRALAGEPGLLFRALFTVGVQRLIAHSDPAAALAAFERMENEARRRTDDPAHGALARESLRLAHDHVRLAASRLNA